MERKINVLYINKQKPDKEILDRIAEIKNFPEWKQEEFNDTKVIRQCFDRLPKEYIRKSLLLEQHYLCAYCMKRIHDDPFYTTIEHWFPLSKDKERALDYNNMIGVCKGGSSVKLAERNKRELCCDAYKGDEEITINPLNQEHMKLIKYTRDGKIYTSDPTLDDDIKKKLRLNGVFNLDGSFKCDTSTGLVKGRRDAYQKSIVMIHVLAKKGKLTSSALRKQIEKIEKEEMMVEFAGVVIFFLKKKCKTLEKQGL